MNEPRLVKAGVGKDFRFFCFFFKRINIITSRRDETAERCERFRSPRFVTTKLPVPRHRDGRSVFNPFIDLLLLAVLAK